jgi:selenocysteine-specific elongation factor
MIIGTSGHIDHGKTSLVRAITGVDADRLKEEKARGITIDLGFAYWPQADGRMIGFVDVPGHEGYIHNMLAGITGVSALMLVVAANEGIKPQTREHLLIADLLGIDRAVVALTKADLSTTDMLELRTEELRELLTSTTLKSAEIIPVSTVTGVGLSALKQALLGLTRTDQSALERPFRLAVDRAFTLSGAGTVVTGGILAGRVNADDKVLLSPQGKEVRVRGLHAQGRQVSQALAGQRAAINLAGVVPEDIKRGDVLMAAKLHRPTQRFDASVRLAATESKPLPAWTAVHLHAGSGFWPARIVPLSVERLGAGEPQTVQVITERPAALLVGDRFVLRDGSGRRTIGGGKILDIHAPERNRRKTERLQALAAMAAHDGPSALPELLQLPPFAVDLHAFASSCGRYETELQGVISDHNLVMLHGDGKRFLFAPPVLLKLGRHLKEHLTAHHAKHPDQAGCTSERLRLALPERLAPEAFAALTGHLIRRGEIAATGAWLRLPDHVAKLSPDHEALWALIRPLLSGDDRFKPPRVNELADHFRKRDETIRGLMKRLARRGDVDEVAEDHYLLREAVSALLRAAEATEAATTGGWFNAAAFRDHIGIGRKMAILILEFFDRHGVTIRKGDLRRVDPRKAGAFAA